MSFTRWDTFNIIETTWDSFGTIFDFIPDPNGSLQRSYLVQPELRQLVSEIDQRILQVPPEDRQIQIKEELRELLVHIENRNLEVQSELSSLEITGG